MLRVPLQPEAIYRPATARSNDRAQARHDLSNMYARLSERGIVVAL
jgi:hypothetical protein